jgi:hypothetical protein
MKSQDFFDFSHTDPFLCHLFPPDSFWESLWPFGVSLFSMSFYSGMKAPDPAMPAGNSAKSQ